MKLIDMLVEELPKYGCWPYGVRYITQDNGYDTYKGAICGYDSLPEFNRKIWLSNKPDRHANVVIMRINNIASDYTTAIITREQYEAALAAKNEGWIEWDGGECPVADFLKVEYQLRGGAKGYESAKILEWQHKGGRHDIIAYRLHQPQEAGKDKVDGETDLNECARQDAAPVWSGEGQPPVGCECEFMKHTLDAMPNWRQGIIKYVSEYTVVIVEALSPGEFVAHPRTCDFRPIRSEAERKRDESLRVIYEILDAGTSTRQDAADIYNAISAGKIPGVKLED